MRKLQNRIKLTISLSSNVSILNETLQVHITATRSNNRQQTTATTTRNNKQQQQQTTATTTQQPATTTQQHTAMELATGRFC